MKVLAISVLVILTAGFARANVSIDDFSSSPTGVLYDYPHSSNTNSPRESAPGTLYDHRQWTVSLNIATTELDYVAAGVTEGKFWVKSTPGSSGGRALLYHDSVYGGPYLDLSAIISEAAVEILFAQSPNKDVSFTMAFQSTSERILLRTIILPGTERLLITLADLVPEGFDATQIYETRWFFTVGPDTEFSIDQIQIVPEPGTFALTALGLAAGVFLKRRMLCPA